MAQLFDPRPTGHARRRGPVTAYTPQPAVETDGISFWDDPILSLGGLLDDFTNPLQGDIEQMINLPADLATGTYQNARNLITNGWVGPEGEAQVLSGMARPYLHPTEYAANDPLFFALDALGLGAIAAPRVATAATSAMGQVDDLVRTIRDSGSRLALEETGGIMNPASVPPRPPSQGFPKALEPPVGGPLGAGPRGPAAEAAAGGGDDLIEQMKLELGLDDREAAVRVMEQYLGRPLRDEELIRAQGAPRFSVEEWAALKEDNVQPQLLEEADVPLEPDLDTIDALVDRINVEGSKRATVPLSVEQRVMGRERDLRNIQQLMEEDIPSAAFVPERPVLGPMDQFKDLVRNFLDSTGKKWNESQLDEIIRSMTEEEMQYIIKRSPTQRPISREPRALPPSGYRTSVGPENSVDDLVEEQFAGQRADARPENYLEDERFGPDESAELFGRNINYGDEAELEGAAYGLKSREPETPADAPGGLPRKLDKKVDSLIQAAIDLQKEGGPVHAPYKARLAQNAVGEDFLASQDDLVQWMRDNPPGSYVGKENQKWQELYNRQAERFKAESTGGKVSPASSRVDSLLDQIRRNNPQAASFIDQTGRGNLPNKPPAGIEDIAEETARLDEAAEQAYLDDYFTRTFGTTEEGGSGSKKIAVVGSREGVSQQAVEAYIDSLPTDGSVTVVSGGARGVDRWAAARARARGIPVQEYMADWNQFGKSAGFRRNQTIVDNADEVVAFHAGESRGTADTIAKARKAGKKTEVFDGTFYGEPPKPTVPAKDSPYISQLEQPQPGFFESDEITHPAPPGKAVSHVGETNIVKGTGGWDLNTYLNDPEYVYIGRSGKGQKGDFGNPYAPEGIVRSEFAQHRRRSDVTYVKTLPEALSKYKEYLANKIASEPGFAKKVADLYGKTLLCPGGKHSMCHGEILAQIAQYLHNGGL